MYNTCFSFHLLVSLCIHYHSFPCCFSPNHYFSQKCFALSYSIGVALTLLMPKYLFNIFHCSDKENNVWISIQGPYCLVTMVSVCSVNSAVREITKSSSTLYATNISSNMICFIQLHDTIKMKSSNHTGINYSYNDIVIKSHILIYNIV